ncbi:MAG: zinc-ribbon domain-containing protein [Promethearchaeota archaeon]
MSQKTPKFCWGCGNQLKPGQKFCTRCGKPVTSQIKNVQPVVKNQTNIASNYVKSSGENVLNNRISKGISSDLAGIEKQIDDFRSVFAKKIEKLEYKINGLDVDNKLIDLNHKIDEFKPYIEKLDRLDKLDKLDRLGKLDKLDELASSEDLKLLNEKLELIKIQDIETKLSVIEEKFDSKLTSIEESIDSFQSDAKIVNLATNTVERLNAMDKNIENFNIETRTRLSKMDNKIEELNSSLSALVPTLLKLNEKVSKLLIKSGDKTIQKSAKKTEESSAPPKSKLDLPPFPA